MKCEKRLFKIYIYNGGKGRGFFNRVSCWFEKSEYNVTNKQGMNEILS
jgi:hypothetical protein